ncbi:hypothetical protein A4A49_16606 [Nicotiana attenuata]|uniref:MADS-box domain-containing protein n=1 Tax=Nicotiana attenuata TaxID=49451 RepID=A0A314LD59_NICAT|nr:hypothetical protein A4A49_16606 [Nicotiana attenuata]
MGRKIEMKKIEEITKRQVTFSKRRSSLIKKAEEIAVCCDVDVFFVAFSPSGRISKFCSQKSIEDMIHRYINLPVERRLTHLADVQNLELQIKKSTLELQILDATIRDYEPGVDQEPSLHQLYWCERNLQQSLQKVMARKMNFDQMELEKQGKLDTIPFHFAAQETDPQQLDTWINPYSASIQRNIFQFQDLTDRGKRVAENSSNYAYNVPFASSSQCGNISFPQIQNSSPYISTQSEQQNMVVDVQQNPAQAFGQSEAQVTFGESSSSSIMNFWNNLCNSTRPIPGLPSTMGTQLNNSSQLELDYAPPNWSTLPYPSNINFSSHNNNHIIQNNDHYSSVQSDARGPNGCNYALEANIMDNNHYFVERTQENDSWEWNDSVLNDTFSVENFSNLD